VTTWLAEHPRFHFHFTPTGASWLNLVERFFAEITRKRLRRGTFRSVPALIAAIRSYVREHNKDPRPFTWTATDSSILRKIKRCKEALAGCIWTPRSISMGAPPVRQEAAIEGIRRGPHEHQ
jgi:hypothetical protein